ncbi:MAG: hypothetical protein ACRELV_01170 [Longimicrobiales bacterium]
MRQEVRHSTRARETASVRGARALSRTVGIGLLAAGAVAASLLLGRSRSDAPTQQSAGLTPDENGAAPPALELDAIRAAGL